MPSDISDPTKPNIPVDPKTYVDNGYSVKAGTMLGASLYGYSRGMRAIHETGHWFGIFHVFERYSCDGDGDLIRGAARQAISMDRYPVSPPQDSYPGDKWKGADLPLRVKEGDDRVDNIMDYSTDACYTVLQFEADYVDEGSLGTFIGRGNQWWVVVSGGEWW
jgi:hypothetical protein